MKYAVYLINLDRAVNRLELMEAELGAAGLHDYQRVSAIDGRNLSEYDFIIKNRFKKDLNAGEVGCFLSHVKAIRLFLGSSCDYAVILEDDLKLKPEFKRTLDLIFDQLESADPVNQWDVLKLYNGGMRRNIFIDRVDDTHFIGSCGTSIPIGAVGAIWTKNGANKFLSGIICDDIPVISRPIDCELQHPWEYDMTICNILPSIVELTELPTQIQMRSEKIRANAMRVIRYELSRLIPKYHYYLKRHGWRKFIGSFIFHENDLVP